MDVPGISIFPREESLDEDVVDELRRLRGGVDGRRCLFDLEDRCERRGLDELSEDECDEDGSGEGERFRCFLCLSFLRLRPLERLRLC